MNWLAQPPSADAFGRAALGLPISEATLRDWATDTQVTLDGERTQLARCLPAWLRPWVVLLCFAPLRFFALHC
jgi:hypothetical protein